MTTGATVSGPSWFLDRKLGEGYKDTLDQSDLSLLRVQREPWSAGVTPERGSKRECPSCPWVCLWKLSRRRVRFSSLLTLMGTLPNLSAMADL